MTTSREDAILAKTWFYPFRLPSGRTTPTYDGGALDAIHTTRLAMLDEILGPRFGRRLDGVRVIDIACHQGYFAVQLAQRGAEVIGVDARAEHIADAQSIGELLALPNLSFAQFDVQALDAAALGQFDLVLLFGLIYHLEDSIGALRTARRLTRGICVVETQVVPGLTGMVDFGSYRFVRPLKGSFGIIDETEETHGPETGTRGICLVPSIEALIWIMYKVGFLRVEAIRPPADGYEQHVHGKRTIVCGYVD